MNATSPNMLYPLFAVAQTHFDHHSFLGECLSKIYTKENMTINQGTKNKVRKHDITEQ